MALSTEIIIKKKSTLLIAQLKYTTSKTKLILNGYRVCQNSNRIK